MTTTGQSYGQFLPDQVDRLAALSDAQIELLADVRELFRERAALEREHATKLQALARKASERKARKAVALVVGDEPTKAWDESTIRRSTLDAAYSQLIGSIAESALDHVKLADSIGLQVTDALKQVERRHDDAKKKQMQFFNKLISECDRVYSDRIKTKQKYDEECTEVESYRQKQSRAQDDRHAERAAQQYEQQQVDMQNAKNVYLVATAVANKTKAKFYDADLPSLENQFQRLQASLLTSLATLLLQAASLEDTHLDGLKRRTAALSAAAAAVSPPQDQDLYIDYNVRPYSAPGDWAFEPCGVHYDTEEMVVEPAAKVFLQNKLAKSRAKLQELGPLMNAKRREVEQLNTHFEAYAVDGSLGNADEMAEKYLDAQHELTFFANSECILKAEVDTISAALAGDEGAQKPHQFKSSSFSIPTPCGYCKSSIWGLSKQGKTCKLCGLSVHSKCELKVPADCGGSKGKHGSTGLVSRSSIASRPSTVASTPTASSFVETHSPPSLHEAPAPARVLFAFSATSPFELNVAEGAQVRVLEEDDGSGWVKVGDSTGGSGLVPASYLALGGGSGPPTPPPAMPARAMHGSGEYVRGLYDYAPSGPDEMSVRVGEVVELSAGPAGGRNYGSGWWEGVDSSGKKGIFPSNYVELA